MDVSGSSVSRQAAVKSSGPMKANRSATYPSSARTRRRPAPVRPFRSTNLSRPSVRKSGARFHKRQFGPKAVRVDRAVPCPPIGRTRPVASSMLKNGGEAASILASPGGATDPPPILLGIDNLRNFVFLTLLRRGFDSDTARIERTFHRIVLTHFGQFACLHLRIRCFRNVFLVQDKSKTNSRHDE